MRPSHRLALLASLITFTTTGCGEPDIQITPDPNPLQLSQVLSINSPHVVGITVEPETGRRFLLEADEGIFELHADGSSTLHRALVEFPQPDVLPASAFTDFVALGGDRFAVTARSDGFLLDLTANTMRQYFCYEPGWEDPIQEQLTDSVAFDATAGLLYAQPQTFEFGFPEDAIASSIGAYTLDGGQPVAWFDMPSIDIRAGGATVLKDGSLLLVDGTEMYRFLPEDGGDLVALGALDQAAQVDGMAFDPTTGTTLIVDSGSDLLLELTVSIAQD